MFKRFISYYKPHKVLFFFDMLASLIVSLTGIFYPIITRKVFKEYIYEDNLTHILLAGGLLLVIYIIRFRLKHFIQYKGHVMGTKMQAKMRSDLFNHLEDLPYSYYDENETGRIMARMTNDLQNISELAHHGPENVFICGFTVIGAFIYLFMVNWILALIILGCVPFLILISLLTRKKMNDAFAENKKNLAEINGSLESSITGIRVTKAFNNKDKEVEKFEVGNNKFVESKTKAYYAMAGFYSTTNFVVDLFNVACIIGGAILVFYKVIDLADYMTFVTAISLFLGPLQSIINFVETYQDGVTGFERYCEIMDEKPEEQKENVIDKINLTGNISFKDVSFSYETKSDVLNHINLDIKKGEVVALVGESGGGKTTICHLLPGFYKVTSGDILFDNNSISDLSFRALRANIGIVQQDVFLFNGTIKENILYGKLDATDEEVILAAKRANIYDYIVSLPNGFETEVGERGVKLSGGQKQRLSIARVFLKNPPILVLDEATSALDNTTEIYIQEALDELAKGRTTIVVAHRLSTIKNATKIVVVSKGEIVEMGTHDELISKNGEYATLYNLSLRK